MKTIYVFLTTGFEEIEALATVDVLRRAGLNAKTVSVENSTQVVASHRVKVEADLLFEEADFSDAALLVLPGGTTRLNEFEELKKLLLKSYSAGITIAAICAAPMVLGGLGLLKGKKATCYPSFEKYLTGAILATDQPVVTDGSIVTGKGPAFSLEFALTLVEIAAGKAKRDEVAAGLLASSAS
ncbi:MAG: DJ-1/PfpI family protein [Prevotellaceae bacterium]|nr:DJ-1/PfpI family protein [Prevotellaceae bacterium]